jgi:hypothetical protein
MFRFVGCADMPGICLKYYVFGDRKKGYGVKIIVRMRIIRTSLFQGISLRFWTWPTSFAGAKCFRKISAKSLKI